MSVEVIIEEPQWERLGLLEAAQAAVAATLRQLGLAPDAVELAVLGCNDARIAVLNADFRGKPQPTNVLSWPEEDLSSEIAGLAPQAVTPGSPQDPTSLGDIAIALETCIREAEEQGKPISDHVTHLLVHGVLHLLGYDHIKDADAALMERLEIEILGNLGLPDPYR